MKSAVIIIPTTGAPEIGAAIRSCLALTYPNVKVLAVVDGPEHRDAFERNTQELDGARFQSVTLTQNVGKDGYYGHRIYAGFSHLVNDDYVLFLDQDNFYEPDHVSSLIRRIEQDNLDWAHSLRRACDRTGTFLFNDDCESLGRWPSMDGYHLVDTSCYCFKRETAIRIASAWHGGWGQDRVVTATLMKFFPRYSCTGAYTMNYRLGKDWQHKFFADGNARMQARHPGGLPWSRGA